MEIVKSLDTEHEIYSTVSVENKIYGLEESKSNTHKTGWAFRRLESKIEEFQ